MMLATYRTGHCGSSRRLGFTLLEMLMAVTITTIITVALYAIFDQTQKAFRAGIAQVDVYESARATSEIFDRDIVRLALNPLEQEFNRTVLPDDLNFYQYPFNIWLDDRAPYATVGNAIQQQAVFTAQQNILFFTRRNDEVTVTGFFNQPLNINWAGGSRPANIPQISRLYRFTRTVRQSDLTPALLQLYLTTFRNGPAASLDDPTRPFQEVTTGVIHLRWNLFGANGQWWQNATHPLLFKSAGGNSPLVGMTAGGLLVPAQVEYELMIMEEELLEQFILLAESNTQQARNYIAENLQEIHLIRKRVSTSLYQ